MPEAAVNGTTLWYDTVGGDGAGASTVLTMHGGLGFDHVYMRRAFERLAGPQRRVVFYDQRGNGRSVGAAVETITMEQLADDAAALLDHLGVERATVIGHSYGGFVAQEFALRHPDCLTALALIDTAPGQLGDGESADPNEQGPPMPEELIALMSRIPSTDEEFAENLPPILPFYLHDRSPQSVARIEAATEGTILKSDAMIQGFVILPGWSSVDRLSSITAPVLVVCGRHDVHTSWPQSRRIASRIPQAELLILEDSAHFPWLEEPDAFYAALEGWLAA